MTTLNLPASYAQPVTPSDTVPLKGQAAFLYVTNSHATDIENVKIESWMPQSQSSNVYAVSIPIPAGVTLPVYIRTNKVYSTGTGADISVVACFD